MSQKMASSDFFCSSNWRNSERILLPILIGFSANPHPYILLSCYVEMECYGKCKYLCGVPVLACSSSFGIQHSEDITQCSKTHIR